MIVFSITTFDADTPFPSLYTLIPTLGTGLLILSAVPNTFIYKLLCLKPIVGIGLISYSIYLWHQPMLAFTRHSLYSEIPNTFLFLLCFGSIFMAWFSWRFVEQPFRDKIRFSRRRIFSLSLILISFFVFVGTGINSHYKKITSFNPFFDTLTYNNWNKSSNTRPVLNGVDECLLDGRDSLEEIEEFLQANSCIPKNQSEYCSCIWRFYFSRRNTLYASLN